MIEEKITYKQYETIRKLIRDYDAKGVDPFEVIPDMIAWDFQTYENTRISNHKPIS